MGIDVWVSRETSEAVKKCDVLVKPELKIPPAELLVDAQVIVKGETAIEVSKEAEVEIKTESLIDKKQSMPTDWNGLQQAVVTCQQCALHKERTKALFGSGNQNSDWLIIGDIPSHADDQQGKIFSDQSGELLIAMLKAIGLNRHQVYLTNTLKCMPANNREPVETEVESCHQYLLQQIELIKPKLILVLGQSAAQRVLKTHSTMARLRQKVHSLETLNIPVVVTYHPSYLLNMPTDKAKAWQDLLFAKNSFASTAVL